MKMNNKKIICDCGKKINISLKQLGKAGRCPRCDKKIVIDRSFFDSKIHSIQDSSNETSQIETMYDADQSSHHFTKEIKKEFGEYEIHEKLGQGGMGVVYKAFDPKIKRYVALKIIISENQKLASRFFKEMEILGKLQHPNIVSLLSYGVEPQPFLIMEYIEGKTLSYTGNIAFKDIALIFQKLANALTDAHSKGIIHRDIKPSNIMMTKKDPKLMDFGLAKLQKDEDQLSRTGEVLGTLSYMSPEQAQGEKITFLTDIYSLGATLYHILVGRPPFDGDTNVNIIFRLCYTDPIAPRSLNPDIPVDLEAICLKCLEKNPRKRYSDSQELSADLDNFIHGHPVKARPYNIWNKTSKLILRHKLVSSLLFGGLILLMTINFIYIYFLQTAQREIKQKHRSSQIALANIALNETKDIFEMNLWQYSALYSAKSLDFLQNLDGEEAEKIKEEARHYFYNSLDNSGLMWMTPKSHKFTHIAYSYDKKYLAVVLHDKIKIQHLESKNTVTLMDIQSSYISFFEFSPKSRYFIVAFGDGRVKIFHLSSKKSKLSFVVHSNFVMSSNPEHQIQLSKNGKAIYYIHAEGYVAEYNIPQNTHTTISEINATTFAVTESEKYLAVYHDKKITIYNQKQKTIQVIENFLHSIVLGADSKDIKLLFLQQDQFLLAYNDSEWILWQKQDQEQFVPYFHRDYISEKIFEEQEAIHATQILYTGGNIAINEEENILAYSVKTKTFIWDIYSKTLLYELPETEYSIQKIQFANNSKELIIFDGRIHTWSMDEERMLWKQSGNIHIDKVIFHDTSKVFATLDKNGQISIWNAATGEQINHLYFAEFIEDIYFQTGDTLTIITNNKIYTWNYTTKEPKKIVTVYPSQDSLGKRVFDKQKQKMYYIKEKESDYVLCSLEMKENGITQEIADIAKGDFLLLLNTTGNMLLVYGEKTVNIVDLENQTTKKFESPTNIRSIKFFHHDNYIVALLYGSLVVFDLDGNIVKKYATQNFDIVEDLYVPPRHSEKIFLLAQNISQILDFSDIKNLRVNKTLLGYSFKNIAVDATGTYLVNAIPEQITMWNVAFELQTRNIHIDSKEKRDNFIQKIGFIGEDFLGVLTDKLEVWNIKENTITWQKSFPDQATNMLCTKNGIYVTTAKTQYIFTTQGQKIYEEPIQYNWSRFSLATNNKFFAIFNIAEQNVEVYDIELKEPVIKISVADIQKLYFSLENNLVITKTNGGVLVLEQNTWKTILEDNFYYEVAIQFGSDKQVYAWGNKNLSVWTTNRQLLWEAENEIFSSNNPLTFTNNKIFFYEYPLLRIYGMENQTIRTEKIIPWHEAKHFVIEPQSYQLAVVFDELIQIYDGAKLFNGEKFRINPLFNDKLKTENISELLMEEPEMFSTTIFSMRIDDSFKTIEDDLFVE